LQALCALQLLLLLFIFILSHNTHIQTKRKMLQDLLADKELQMTQIQSTKLDVEALTYRLTCSQNVSSSKPEGTVLLLLTTKQPVYYQTLSFKLNNILQNIPSNWVIQIFYKNSAAFRKGLARNPGLKRHFVENKRIFAMEIPRERELPGHREVHYRLQYWLWSYTVAENVLVVDGKQVCVCVYVYVCVKCVCVSSVCVCVWKEVGGHDVFACSFMNEPSADLSRSIYMLYSMEATPHIRICTGILCMFSDAAID
jgi:hypothetical protein